MMELNPPSLRRCLPLILALFAGATGLGAPTITEFMAANNSGLADEDGDTSDWIEIYNPDSTPIALAGYHLTDDVTRPAKWTFPAVTLNAGAYLVVFASGKDRINPAAPLHTNFALAAEGGYLALVAPDGVTALSAFAPAYPPQFDNVSFGFGQPGSSGSINLAPGWTSPGNYANVSISGQQTATENGGTDSLDSDAVGGVQYYMWFDFGSRLGQLPPGSVVTSATLSWRGATGATLFGSPTVDSNVGVFPVPDARHGIDSVAANFSGHDIVDYYAAHTPVAAFNAVHGQTTTATWNLTSLVQQWVDTPGSAQRGQIMLLDATRPMFVHWNADATSRPTITLDVATTSDPNAPPAWSFFSAATPGAANAVGTRAGPIFGAAVRNPPQPVDGPLLITAAVRPIVDSVASVTLYYRSLYAAEVMLPMKDDGLAGDAVAGDGVWSAIIPASAFAPSQMTRWRFVATDSKGTETNEPPFRNPTDSPQYFGTVAYDPTLQSRLPVFHWFTTAASAAGTITGSRGSVYYDGEFYDNVFFSLHGQSSAGFPKKSYNIDFNRPQRFRWSPDALRVADIHLLTNWADKSKVRHVLAYEVMRESGVHAHFAFTVRVQQNGTFFSTADFVEDGDDLYLSRTGLNPKGALYKMYNSTLTVGENIQAPNVEKKNGDPNDRSDLGALITNLALANPALTNYLYDNIDIPATVDMIAANSVIRNIDLHVKNWYIYRDTGVTNEWSILPWDLDLSQGRVWNTQNTYFDNNIYIDGYVINGTAVRLISQLFSAAPSRAMIMRRIRTLTDRFLQPPPAAGTPESSLYYERRLNEQSALIDPPDIVPSDARRDFEKWGSWLQAGQTVPYTNTNVAVETMARGIQRWKTEYLPGRRNYIYNTQIFGKGGEIPLPQTAGAVYTYTPLLVTGGAAKVLVPANADLGINWIGIPSFEPFDTEGWTNGTTGVGYERATGYQNLIGTNVNTQMQSNNSVYIRTEFNLANLSGIDRLEFRIKYDDGYIAFLNGAVLASANAPASLQWNSASTAAHEANATAFDIIDVTSKKVNLQVGRNVLAIQGLNENLTSDDMIIVPELYIGTLGPPVVKEPTINFGTVEFAPASGNQDQEFIQLLNQNTIAVDISNWRLTGGIEHTFHPGTVLPANGSLYLSPDVTAFRARTVSPKGGEGRFVQGGYVGHLSSLGETLTLLDSSGAVNNTFTYQGQPSDAQRYLVITELMYRPPGDGLAEYIELTNISSAVTLDLTGVRFTKGVDFDFTGSAITSLAPGARVLVVRDLAAFQAAHGPGLPIAGVFANDSNLSNGGETVKIEDASSGTIQEFTYDDALPWPGGADGAGYSLVLIAPETNPDPALPASWRASALPGGTPGGSDGVPLPAAPMADANGNGVIDLLDYALGNNLGTAPVPPTFTRQTAVAGQPGSLLVSYPISLGADRAQIKVLISTDLATWQDAATNLELVSSTPLGDGRAMITWRVKPPLADEARLFMRLNVTAP